MILPDLLWLPGKFGCLQCANKKAHVAGLGGTWAVAIDVDVDGLSAKAYSTVTDLARLRGLSTSVPRAKAV